MKHKLIFTCLLLTTIAPLFVQAGKPPITKWTAKNPFEQKVFIENKGQYRIQDKVESNAILFGARLGGLQYYFTTNSIWIKRDVRIARTTEEIEQFEKQFEGKGEKDEKDFKYKMVEEFHQISFEGSNPLAEITSSNEISCYYNFTINGNIPVKSHAYKKLTYLNLYPGIDMEFYFPEDKQGFEYSFIVHPGADPSQIKIQFPINNGIQLNEEKEIIVQSPFGSFIHHAPVAIQQGKTVDCSFSLDNSIVGFNVSDYNKSQNLIIDPWTLTPGFVGTNDGYDVDWDNVGNCYVYGGDSPWQLIKYNSSGTMLWSYTEDFTSPYPYYGGMAVDRNSQSAYLVEGFNSNTGAGVIKVSPSGAQSAMFQGNQDFREMWRIAFSRCTNRAVIAGGGTSSPTYQACYLDTNLTNLSPVNILNVSDCCHDLWGITLDNYGNCYTATVTTYADDSFENVLLKLPLPNLTPTTWMVSDGYEFIEASSTQFAVGGYGPTNAFNGMTISNIDLFTYDSYTLKKWNSANGALLNSVAVNATFDSSSMYWAGITSDDCDNVFLGSMTDIQQYDGNLNLKNTIAQPDTIYALSLGKNNILYACGAGFVSAIQVTIPSCNVINVTNNITNATCTAKGSVTIVPSGGTPPYKIVWNTTPQQTGTTLSNLTNGTYIATISDSSCVTQTTYDTVKITKIGSDQVTVNNPVICNGNSVTLTAAGATNYIWYPSAGLSATTGSSVTANPTITTSYFVVGSGGAGCPDTIEALVTVDSVPAVSVLPAAPGICPGQNVILTAQGANTYSWSPSTGLSATSGSSVTANPTVTTTYTIAGSNGGCIDSVSVTVTVSPPVTITVSPTAPSICSGQNVVLTAKGATTYQWSPSAGLSATSGASVIATPGSTATYTVSGSNGGCPDSVSVTITVTPTPVVSVTPAAPSICIGQGVALTASGATTYKWNPSAGLSATTGSSITANPTITTTYTVKGLNGICSDSITVIITVDTVKPVITVSPTSSSICKGQSVGLSVNGAITYQWSPSAGLNAQTGDSVIAAPTLTTTYTVVGLNGGCSDTATLPITVNYGPKVTVIPSLPVVCIGQSVGLNATGALTYLWSPSTGLNVATDSSVIANPTITTKYVIVATNALCSDSTFVTVFVDTGFVVTVTPSSPSICLGQNVVFTANGTSSYQWNPSTGLNETNGSSVSANPTLNTTYTIIGTDTAGCMDSTKVTIVIDSIPISSFSTLVPNICNPAQIQFVNTSTGATEYLWDFGDGTTSTENNITHTYNRAGIYQIKLISISDHGCDDTISVTDTVITSNDLAAFANAFLPNTEGVNAYFLPKIGCPNCSDYVFRVYNRWGQLLFSTNDPTVGWDGRFNGAIEPIGVYDYYMDFVCGTCTVERQGNITLLK